MMKTNETTSVKQLNGLLADMQIAYQNFRTLHWLVKGRDFFSLHKMYEEFYTELAETIDEVAERILTMGGIPYHRYEEYIEHAKIKAVDLVPNSEESIILAIHNYEHMLETFTAICSSSAEQGDEGTLAIVSTLVANTEKKLWMLKTTLSV